MARKGRLWGKPVKSITVGEKVPLELNQRERDLIIEHTFADNDLTDRLRIVPSPGRRSFYRFTLDELDELAGYCWRRRERGPFWRASGDQAANPQWRSRGDQHEPLKVAERFSLTRCRTSEIMRARQATRTAQQGCGAVAAGQLDTEDEPGGGRSQPLFLGCQTLTGGVRTRVAGGPAERRAPRRP
jgi:hypothetical protein